jgi:hypothetical protein
MNTVPASRAMKLASRGAEASIGLFGWFRSIRRLVQWALLASRAARITRRRALHKLAGRFPPAADPHDVATAPIYYRQLIDELNLPDRLPLSPLERTQPGEASAIRMVARLAASAVIRMYCDAQKADPDSKAMRDQHAKPHGCLQAQFLVRDDLPLEFEAGVFRRGRVYDAVVRFSNAMGSRQSDRKPDGRGMAVKLRLQNDDGVNLLSTLFRRCPPAEQDFLMTNYPVFFCKGVPDYSKFIEIVALPGDSLAGKLRKMARFLLFFFPWRLPQFLIFAAQALIRIDSPLRGTYHSMTPYRLGDNKVVRYSASPVQTPGGELVGANGSRQNFLHDALVAELDPGQPRADAKAVFDFSVRVRHEATPDDVEDASRAWRSPGDKTVSLGRIEIPLQSFDRCDQVCDCENLSFNPWNALPEHRPLGGLNRMRLAVYLASKQVRHRLNMV